MNTFPLHVHPPDDITQETLPDIKFEMQERSKNHTSLTLVKDDSKISTHNMYVNFYSFFLYIHRNIKPT